ncbi:hypothetical protein [Tumebacillus lipolyticus]|uniref:Uncharacterized protein n=1 Tax=Tumebacillus lipolyticus TaxID=1280370 RepID=A0ABW4ZRL2_9BACL
MKLENKQNDWSRQKLPGSATAQRKKLSHSSTLTAAQKVMQLQQSVGNRSVLKLMAGQMQRSRARTSSAAPIQCAKPGDAPPTIESQLEKRLNQMSKEAGIGEPLIVQYMTGLIDNEMVMSTLIDPQQNYPIDVIVKNAIKEQLKEDNSDYDCNTFKAMVANMALPDAARLNLIDQLVPEIDSIIDPFWHRAQRAIYTDPNFNSNPELLNMVQQTTPGGDQLNKAATDYLTNNPRPALMELPAEQRAEMIVALKEMPIVKSMLDGTLSQGGDAQGVHLLNGFDQLPGASITFELINRVQQALSRLASMVDRDKLPPTGRVPNIQVNPDEVVDLPQTFMEKLRGIRRQQITPFRANANRDDNRVRLSALDDIATIVHEFGHQIEFFLPVEEWLDIQELLRMRHQGNQLISIYPHNPKLQDEAAFNAQMPATGLYSAKVYDDGSTEVMSRTLEFFAEPETALRMIERDPLQAAIILRMIKPNEFRQTVPDPLRALLPRGDV